MTNEELIKQKIIENFAPEHFELVNESDRHIGHKGHDGTGQSHFNLMVVSSAFEGCNRVQRHRLVYELMEGLFKRGLHALSIKALTPSEYKSK